MRDRAGQFSTEIPDASRGLAQPYARLTRRATVRRVIAVTILAVAAGCSATTRPVATSDRATDVRSEGVRESASATDDALAATGDPSAETQTKVEGDLSPANATDRSGAPSAASGGDGPSCSTPLRIGVSYSSDLAAAAASASANAISGGTIGTEAQAKQFYGVGADDLNRRGGVGGCPVTPVFHDFQTTSAEGWDAESQKECSDFADDKRVFAAHMVVAETEVFVTCMARRRIPVFLYTGLGSPIVFPTKADFAGRYRGILYAPGGVAVDRLASAIDILHGAGYFGRQARLGILIADIGHETNQRLVSDVWQPRLKALGIEVVSTFTYPIGHSLSDSRTQSSMAAATLRFKGAGVTHVLVAPDNGSANIWFTQAASSQGYHPRIGETGYSSPATMSLAPAEAASGAMVVSWATYLFGNQGAPPGDEPPNPARDRCRSMYEKPAAALGVPVSIAYPWCDTLEFLRSASGGRSPSTDALLAGAERLGVGYTSASTYGPTRFAAGRYDGGEQVRVLTWDADRKGWKYVSNTMSLS